ncbi:MAG: zf-HC2 domain-containing protein, partial [Blastocatellia bacterium]|nr:zf-HC2 domain-containing protein [Blastocatellia bacterium]
MNCELCRSELEDFLYGELSEARASRVRAHLAACRDCAAAHDSLERENELFAQYYERTAVDPPPEMWDAIRQRISAEEIRAEAVPAHEKKTVSGALKWLFRPSLLRQAAFSVLLVALTVAVTTWVLKRGRDGVNKGEPGNVVQKTPAPMPRPAATPQPATPAKPPEMAMHRTVTRARRVSGASADNKQIGEQIARAEREYRHAIRLLESAIASRKEALDPELQKQYENSLALIDSSIAASRRALRERPDDLAAGQFLLAAY